MATEPPQPDKPEPPDSVAGQNSTQANEAAPANARAPESQQAVSVTAGGKRYRRADGILVGLLFLLAFFVSAVAIRKVDFWMHLATGRFLTEDITQLGVDPFLYTSEGVLWVNHSWLFDLLVFNLLPLIGGAGLVVVNCLIGMAALWVMLKNRPAQGNVWIAVVCCGLAVTAMSPLLLFDPACFSVLFLAITCWLLMQPPGQRIGTSKVGRLWLLPALFLLWVNLDVWFILGPVCVLLVLVGAAAQFLGSAEADAETQAQRKHRLRELALVLAVGLLACLINPFTYHAFTLPTQLGYLLGDFGVGPFNASGAVLHQLAQMDAAWLRLIPYFQSPLVDDYWRAPLRGPNFVALSYFLLLLGGMASFLALLVLDNEPAQRATLWPRFALWLFFAVLSLAMAWLILFFAVVAGPITAWNWQEFAARRAAAGAGSRRLRTWSAVGRFLTGVVLVILIVLAWPGWLQLGRGGTGSSPYRVHFDLVPDPGFVQAALDLGEMQARGELQRCFNFSPALACYCAWYSPEVKSFHDFRFGLLRGKASALAKIRQGIRAKAELANRHRVEKVPDKIFAKYVEAVREQQEKMMEHGITHLALTNVMSSGDTSLVVQGLLLQPFNWRMVHATSHLTTFAWSEQPASLVVGKPPFGPDFAVQFLSSKTKVKGAVMRPQTPAPPNILDAYLFGTPRPSPAADQAAFYLLCHEVLSDTRHRLYTGAVEMPLKSVPTIGLIAGNLLGIAPGVGPLCAPITVGQGLYSTVVAPDTTFYLSSSMDPGPPGLTLLAMKSAREAVLENPNDPHALRVLMKAHEALWLREEEYWRAGVPGTGNTVRQEIREKQRATMLHRLTSLQPDDLETHSLLAEHCMRNGYLDFALDHLKRAKELMAEIAAPPGDKQLKEKKAQLEKLYQDVSEEVPARLMYLAARTSDQPPPARAFAAMLPPNKLPFQLAGVIEPQKYPHGLELGKEALRVLNELNLESLPPPARRDVLAAKLEILTRTGRMEEVITLLTQYRDEPNFEPVLAFTGCLVGAALGDYALFEQSDNLIQTRILGQFCLRPPGFLELDVQLFERNLTNKKLTEVLAGTTQFTPAGPKRPSPAEVLTMLWLPGDVASFYHVPQAAGTLTAHMAAWRALKPGVLDLAEHYLVHGLIALEFGDSIKAEQLLAASLNLLGPDDNFPDRAVAANRLRQIQEAKQRMAK